MASIFSIHGCIRYRNEVRAADLVGSDAERGTYVAPTIEDNANQHIMTRTLNSDEESYSRKPAGAWGYAFQIVFQASSSCNLFHSFDTGAAFLKATYTFCLCLRNLQKRQFCFKVLISF